MSTVPSQWKFTHAVSSAQSWASYLGAGSSPSFRWAMPGNAAELNLAGMVSAASSAGFVASGTNLHFGGFAASAVDFGPIHLQDLAPIVLHSAQESVDAEYRKLWQMAFDVSAKTTKRNIDWKGTLALFGLLSLASIGAATVTFDDMFFGRVNSDPITVQTKIRDPNAQGQLSVRDRTAWLTTIENYMVPNWDGEGAIEVQQATVEIGKTILRLLPFEVPDPDIDAGTDGSLLLDWFIGNPGEPMESHSKLYVTALAGGAVKAYSRVRTNPAAESKGSIEDSGFVLVLNQQIRQFFAGVGVV